MPDRIEISRRSKPIPCGECGHRALHVGRVFSGTGALLGNTLVCTVCRRDARAEVIRRAA